MTIRAAYGGMRYRSESPPTLPLTSEFSKISLFDTVMPVAGRPLLIEFDASGAELVLAEDQEGVYRATTFMKFQGSQNEIYTFNVHVDEGEFDGPQPTELEARIVTPSFDSFYEFNRSVLFQCGGPWRFSLWAKCTGNFNLIPYSINFDLERVGPRRTF